MTLRCDQTTPTFDVIGGDVPSDELLDVLAELLLQIVDQEETDTEERT